MLSDTGSLASIVVSKGFVNRALDTVVVRVLLICHTAG